MIKKIVSIACLIAVLFATTAFADVILTWDDNPSIERVDLYQVEIDGQIVADVIPNTFTLLNIEKGTRVARVRAHNVWGWGEFSAPFEFTKETPSATTGLRIINMEN